MPNETSTTEGTIRAMATWMDVDASAAPEMLMPVDQRRLVRDLIDVGTGKIPHRFMGQCPDSVDGHHQRDKSCRACRILIRANSNIANAGDERQAPTQSQKPTNNPKT